MGFWNIQMSGQNLKMASENFSCFNTANLMLTDGIVCKKIKWEGKPQYGKMCCCSLV